MEETPQEGSSLGRGLYPWRMPQPFCYTSEVLEKSHPLMVFNSLTRTKVRFIPINGKKITWYQCGPTVYAESHMGHARTYVSLDILRRILQDYFGYEMLLCQNITDIDDKIIVRSSEQNVSFTDLAKKFEAEFVQDMQALGVLLPDLTTRVSEYVPEIVDYIEDLQRKGIAYETPSSVYFSVQDFEAQGHTYGKLMPEQIGNLKLLAEGEGSLCAADQKRAPSDFVLWKKTKGTVKQKSIEGEGFEDKKVKEPSWDSPWGPGRPGWHIECSVMSFHALQKLLGDDSKSASASRKPIDVHAGGVDLKFPHHENEIAQSEAFSGSHQWVNYWLHTGHLNIDGSKMSKSLKNFITIRGALEHYSARQIRFCFLLHKYNAAMDYSQNTMSQAVTAERSFVEFFHNLKAVLRRLGPVTGSVQHVGAAERELFTVLDQAKREVRESLVDDFDTPRAVAVLQELIRSANKLLAGSTSAQPLSSTALLATGRYITAMLRVFGLVPGSTSSDSIGFPLSESSASEDTAGETGQAGLDKEALLTPFLDSLSTFRSQVRAAAIAGDTKQVLALADILRDELLPELGVRLEDLPGGQSSIWKLDDPAQMRKERAQKEEIRIMKELEKQKQQQLQREREEKAKVPPELLFRAMTDLYSAFDEHGLPTHDTAGEPLQKNVVKKLQKDHSKQKEIHEKYLSKLKGSEQAQSESVDEGAGVANNL